MSKPFWQFKAAADGNAAELLLYGPISESTWWGDEVTPKQFAEDLAALGNISDLTVRINSGGGDVFAGQAIYSLLRSHPARVTVRVDGLAASIASIIAMAGDEVIMPANAMMMVHNPWIFAMGNADELRTMADTLDTIRESLLAVYEAKTGLDRDTLTSIMDKETWLTAADAKSYGFADTLEDLKVSASARGSVYIVNGVRHDLSYLPVKPEAVITPEEPNANTAVEDVEGAPLTPDDVNSDAFGDLPAAFIASAGSITAADVESKFPEIIATIRQEAAAVATLAERQRIAAINDLTLPGCEEIITAAIADGTSPNEVATRIIAAAKERQAISFTARLTDAENSGLSDVHAVPAPVRAEKEAKLAKQTADWKQSFDAAWPHKETK